ncbi:hypothetical protein ATL41_0973 [Flavimobilis soli]|jgi:streptogrisin C|uniref:Trypsin n=1 Tax=Flavimobilis soli TaxID=442709 RepID=A0A2A9EB10_9MICO|nr:hypothetical protein [Flavimobilis soli]PFG36257.1 hypothetical protein ATL41_0973 [Flavimobilis soli]
MTDTDRSRIWYGAASPEVERAAEALSNIAAENEDLTAGVSLTSDSSMVEIYLTRDGQSLVKTLRKAVGTKFDSLIRVIEVEHSTDELLAAQAAITDEAWDDLDITQLAPDVENNALAVDLDIDKWESLSQGAEVIELAPDQGKASRRALSPVPQIDVNALGVPVLLREGGTSEPTGTRKADTAPFYGGAEIVNQTNGSACSLGVPIVYNSVRYMLTAGHCGKATFKNGKTTVGSTYTTTWTGTTKDYGDWQLIKGSTYSMRLYNGALSSSASLPISRGNFGSRANGTELCSTGRTTGQICRYRVLKSHATRDVAVDSRTTTKVGYLTVTMSDPNRDGVGTCTGFKPGDSGGSAYYADPDKSGYVRVLGIVTSSNDQSPDVKKNCSKARYSFTELKGVRAWNGGVTTG